MFCVRAETNCALLIIKSEVLFESIKLFPGNLIPFIDRSIKRYIAVKYSMEKFATFKGINQKDMFWKEKISTKEKGMTNEVNFYQILSDWLDKIDEKGKLNKTILLGHDNK